jgi:hypothetical protein
MLLLKIRDKRFVFVNRADRQTVKLKLTPKRNMKQVTVVGCVTFKL